MTQNLNTKGFTLLELLVVIVIIGAISAAGYPNFLNWSKDRKVRKANDRVAGLITRLNTQTQRGVYPFAQAAVCQIAKTLLALIPAANQK